MKFLFLAILVGIFSITLVYTYGVSQVTQNKWFIFLPTELAVLAFGWYSQKYLINTSDEYGGLTLFFLSLHLFFVLFPNLFFGFLFLKRNKKKRN